MQARRSLTAILFLWSASLILAQDGKPTDRGALDAWLQHQEKVKNWTADVQQARKLKAVKRTLTTPGKIWFVGHRRFRWQLGDPVRTLAFRKEQQLLVLYPRLRRAEKYLFTSSKDPAMKQARLLMDVGFPTKAKEFHARYELLGRSETETAHQFELRPREAKDRELLSRLTLTVRKSDWALLVTAMTFPDGSSMSNTFSNHKFDIELPEDLLEPDLTGYELVEPLKDR